MTRNSGKVDLGCFYVVLKDGVQIIGPDRVRSIHRESCQSLIMFHNVHAYQVQLLPETTWTYLDAQVPYDVFLQPELAVSRPGERGKK